MTCGPGPRGCTSEPAVEDGGTIIIYAPHITEVSYCTVLYWIVWATCRDCFLTNWGRVSYEPAAVLAHSCHLKGSGTYLNGVETPRVH